MKPTLLSVKCDVILGVLNGEILNDKLNWICDFEKGTCLKIVNDQEWKKKFFSKVV